MNTVQRTWEFICMLYQEGMLHRTADGQKLGFFSARGWGANMMCAGIAGLAIFIFWIGQRTHFETRALETVAVVVSVTQDRTSDGTAVYALTLRWTDQNGKTHVTVPKVKSSAYNVPVGTELDIKYDPGDATDVRVETVNGPWYLPRVILLGSVLSFLFGWTLRQSSLR